MITLIFSAASFIIILSFIISVIYFPKFLAVLIPLIFAMLFGVMTLYPNYEGYAVDSKFIPLGSEASVISVIEGQQWIYLTLEFPDSDQPRLVKIVSTPNNKKQAEDALAKSKKGLSIIRFDRTVNSENSQQGDGSLGDNSSTSGQSNGGDLYGPSIQDNSGVSIRSVDVNESSTFKKSQN